MRFAFVFVAYLFACELALWVQALTGMGTQIWPASGIALASVIIWGPRISPAIFFATITIHAIQGDSILAFFGPAVGNTIEPLVGAYFCLKIPPINRALNNLRDISRLIFGAAILGALAGTLVGVPYLWFTQLHKVDLFYFMQYWVGDAVGILMVAPLILVYSTLPEKKFEWRLLKKPAYTGLAFLLLALTVISTKFRGFVPIYFFFPLMLWAAIRHGQRGVTVTILILAAVTISETALGIGPFALPARSILNEFSLLFFVATLQMTGLVVSSIFTEREGLLVIERKGKQEAETTVRMREEFMDLAAHELNTPITSLILALQLLKERPEKRTPERVSHLVDICWNQASRLKKLSHELLDVTILERGHLELEVTHFDLRELVREVVSRFELNLLEAHCSVLIQADEPIEGDWDCSRIDEVITNLLSNAVKYGRDHPIEIALTKFQENAVLKVRDHGIGIEPSLQARLFQRFERGTYGHLYSGLGLGLYLLRKIVVAHGGSVSVESSLGEGALFTVELPCKKSEPLFQS